MGLMKARPQFFTDLAEYGLDSRKADFPAAKWDNGINADGKLFALGTDIGGMTMCYRTDLFKKAGLPTDREEVGKLWPDWNAFIEIGKKFQAANPGKGDPKFLDGPNTLYNVILSQEAPKNGNVSYFDKSNQLVLETNPAVKTSFDTVKIQRGRPDRQARRPSPRRGTPASRRAPSPPWSARPGCSASSRATAGASNKGKWDVAAVPGGGGNWGGSWLAVPKQSKHPKEAAEARRTT